MLADTGRDPARRRRPDHRSAPPRHVKNAVQVAEAMVAAARQQTVTLPG
ncbi:hypothetical protein [Micromonospora sp. WMMD975]|nr:hypothetical protein [Micromonospora sp. WMMD975]WFE33535.1 hypothetical protein O7613_29135 [Micromonospora sp. WMMD975]